MKAKIKRGEHILFSEGVSNKWDNIKTHMIINFMNKYTFNSFNQVNNHLFIDTTEGEVDIVFTSDIPLLEFYSFNKDQLVLKVI